jgi:2-keto-4-pentenoate hydratase/2-oxohepta-3-ene-1,7-dioic acid hydratase in catechol pathway
VARRPGGQMEKTSILIVGGGPVGMTIANDLAHRGVRSILIERNPVTTSHLKMDITNGRSMELFRRIGLVDAHPTKLTLETRLNGQVVQNTTTDKLITSIPGLITYCSAMLPLLPGDVIVTGTPGGVGLMRNPPLFMKPGDTVEVEVSGIDVLRNPVIAEV